MLTYTHPDACAIAQAALEGGARLIPYSHRQVYGYDQGEGESLALYIHTMGPRQYVATVVNATEEQLTEAPLEGFGVTEKLAIIAALTGQPTIRVTRPQDDGDLPF